ncbi:arylesterase [Aurantiacibacter sp. MUD61]|uniref:arylesterase n=1 Tax=Aurantiacibacter sp. MUD61 TaxID=3009083 RepID=UPI0022F1158D|nr:arylesterase [Aurantiacibacter sp. MUD61]
MNKPSQSPWRRGVAASSIAFALTLSACESEAPVAEPETSLDEPIEEALPVMGPERVILGFGDSLMAGYQLPEEQGYPEKLEAVMRTRGINARVIDAGVSGDTTAAGLQRIGFVLDNLEETPDLAIVELGGNDLLRGFTPDQTRENLTGILDALAARDIPVILMGMRAPPNYGAEYQASFDGLYPALAEEYDAALVPFFMAPLLENPSLLMDDRIHPTAEGVEEMVAATVDDVIAALPEEDS